MSDIPFSVRGNLTSLDRLKDVNIENVVNGEVLEYSGDVWENSTPSTSQVVLDTPVVATPSGTGNLTLTNGTGTNSLLTLTPPDKNNITGDTTVTGDLTATGNIISDNTTVGTLTSTSVGLFTNGITVPVSGSSSSILQAMTCTEVVATGLVYTDSLSSSGVQVGGNLTVPTCNLNDLTIGGVGFGNTINWVSQPIWLRTSDSRLKWNQEPITNGLEKVMKLKPMTYEIADNIVDEKPDDAKKSAGFIAQDIEAIPEFSEYCHTNEEDNILRIDYGAILTHSVQAVKELSVKLQMKKDKVYQLENIINNIMIKIK